MAPAEPGRVVGEPARGVPVRGLLLRRTSQGSETAASGVMQRSAIGAGDDCCDRGRSRSSRALWRGPRVRRRPVLTTAPPLVAIVALTAWP